MTSLAERVLKHIRRRELMRAGDRVAVAVSGGADSVALLRLMLELRSELGVVLSVAHFNHGIRGQASDEDEAFVRDLAAAHSLDFHRAEADVPAHAREHKLSLETAARQLRYEFFASLINDGEVRVVATAHTLDDQAETVLMRIIRGTGITGLAGIQPNLTIALEPHSGEHPTGKRTASAVPNGSAEQSAAAPEEHAICKIVRPLLETRRSDLEAYLLSTDQCWREDASNTELHHTRNRIRQLVVPLLEREFNPAIRERLAELAEIARGEEEWWNNVIDGLLREAKHDELIAVRNMGGAIARRLIRALAAVQGLELDFEHTEAVREMVIGGRPRCIEVGGNFVAELTPTHLRFRRAGEQLRTFEYHLTLLNEVALPELGTILRTEFPARALQRGTVDWSAVAASDKLSAGELILRPWRAGDRFFPQHSSGPKKVKELLTDKHITGAERQLWPVIACGDDIVWLRGFGVSQSFAAPEGATEVIVITETPLDQELPDGQ